MKSPKLSFNKILKSIYQFCYKYLTVNVLNDPTIVVQIVHNKSYNGSKQYDTGTSFKRTNEFTIFEKFIKTSW